MAAAGLGAAVVKAADFDAAMSKVSAATGETATNMDRLRKAALDAGAQTVFSATEAADGIEQLAKAGVSTTDILNGGLSGALDLAAAGEISVGEAAEVAAKAMTQFGLAGNQVPHIADLLASAAGNASGEVSDFGMALSQSGLVADQVGLSLEETTGGLAAFASAGLLGSDAGTSFKTMLGALTPNSAKAAKQMEALGLSAYDSQGQFIGLAEFAGRLQTSLGDMTDEQRQATLETIFGSDAVRAAAVLYEQGATGIEKWTNTVDDQGAAARMAGERLDNLKGDFEALGGAVETALIGIGSSSQGPLRAVTQGVTAMVNDFGELPDAAQTATAAVMAGSALVGGSVWVGTKVVQGIANTGQALSDLGYDGDKATKAMKGLATAGAGLAVLGTAAVAIRAVQEATDETVAGVETLQGRLIDVANTPSGFSINIGKEFDSLAESIDRVTDKSKSEAFFDGLQTPFEPLFGEGAALREARTEIDALDESLAALAASGNADVAADALARITEGYGLTEEQMDGLLSQLPKYDEAMAGIENQTKLAGDATSDTAATTEDLGGAFEDAGEAAQDFKDLMDSLNAVLGGRADMRDYQAAIDDFSQSLRENGRTFDINTEKGRNNQAALDNIAASALAVAENMSQAQRQKFLTAAIADIRTMAERMGLPKSEVRRLIELLREANNADVSPKINVDTAQSLSKIQAVRNSIESLRNRNLTVTTVYKVVRNASDALPYRGEADGGVLDFYAAGGIRENHVAQIAPAGTWRVWAEPETGGEAYIPLAESKRARSIDIWEEVGQRLGVEFERFADGSAGDDRKRKPRKVGAAFDSAAEMTPNHAMLQMQADATAAAFATARQLTDSARIQEHAAETAFLAAQDQVEAAEQNTRAAEEGLRSAESIRDATQQMRDSLADSVSSQFTGSLLGAGLAGLTQTLGRDINAGSSMDTTLQALIDAGLDTTGPAAGLLAEIAASEDLRTATELLAAAQMDPEFLTMIEQQYAQRAQINTGRGALVADAMYSQQLASENAAVAVATAQLAQAEAAEAAATARAAALESHLGHVQDQLDAQRTATENLADQLRDALNSVVRPGR
ncbi:phage tail tape measure protein [Nocardioides sp. SYSU D00065]|uniref:phage tail tape measure protein n=1 Tax=Nocardioides sp. SYSU D00065 TaxID=2817378 RepID=UPI001B33C716|nr:phage tail tape measure protein [Nocardioides sp. SYSU D00065]